VRANDEAAVRGSARDTAERQLLRAVKQHLSDIDALLKGFESWEEDAVYRYYHQSFKVYNLQRAIRRVRQLFEELAPNGTELNPWFVAVCQGACAHEFDIERSNRHWQEEIRPILEGFWHCQYFLRQLARYGRGLEDPPDVLPYGWAAVLHLYRIR
jgi:hypothetical protein